MLWQLEQLRFDSEEAKKKLVSREEELNKLRGKGACQLRHWVAEDDRRLEELQTENRTLGVSGIRICGEESFVISGTIGNGETWQVLVQSSFGDLLWLFRRGWEPCRRT